MPSTCACIILFRILCSNYNADDANVIQTLSLTLSISNKCDTECLVTHLNLCVFKEAFVFTTPCM